MQGYNTQNGTGGGGGNATNATANLSYLETWPFPNLATGCADKGAARDRGLVCDGAGLRVTTTGAYAYQCCAGDKCNENISAIAANLSNALAAAIPTPAYCQTPVARQCVRPFAETYKCLLTSVPNVVFTDECFSAYMPAFGCLEQHCADLANETLRELETLDFATPGCPLEKIGDRLCDPLCMTPESAFDGGDCLVVATAIKRKFSETDYDADGAIENDEYQALRIYTGPALLSVFDIDIGAGADSAPALDEYEFWLLLSTHDDMTRQQLHAEVAGEPTTWARRVALGCATQMLLMADEDMNGMLSRTELAQTYGLNADEFALILRIGGRTAGFYAKVAEFATAAQDDWADIGSAGGDEGGDGGGDAGLREDKFAAEAARAQITVADLGKIVHGVLSSITGDRWADAEAGNGFSVEEAVRLVVKMADYNEDGYMSRGESVLLMMPPDLFSAISPAGTAGDKLSLEVLTLVAALAQQYKY